MGVKSLVSSLNVKGNLALLGYGYFKSNVSLYVTGRAWIVEDSVFNRCSTVLS